MEKLGKGHTASKWPSRYQHFLSVQNHSSSYFMLLVKWCVTGLTGGLMGPEEARKGGL